MSPDLRKAPEPPREIRFAHPHRTGWVVAVVGTLVCAFGLAGTEGGQEWAVMGFGILFLLGGVLCGLYRLELTLDLARRRYWYRRGFVPAPREGGGSIDEIEAAALDEELAGGGSDRLEEWEVELVVKNWLRPVELAGILDEGSSRPGAASEDPIPGASLLRRNRRH